MSPAVFAHGHLRLYLLFLLAERPMHGYDLIRELGDRVGGTYAPSAGTIYPRLAKLEEEGLVTKQAEGRKSVYAITDAGRAELAGREEELDGIETELSDSVRRLADEVRSSVEGAMRSLRADLAAAAREARDAVPPSTPSTARTTPAPDPRGESRIRVHEADLAINDFRVRLRTDLRRAASAGTVDAEAIRVLREGLARVQAEVTEALSAAG